MKKTNIALMILAVILTQTTRAASYSFQGMPVDTAKVEINKKAIVKSYAKTGAVNLEKIAVYLAFVGLTPDKVNFKFQLVRLINSSTQFILCASPEDWACLEKTPVITPKAKSRIDTNATLGEPINAGEKLDIEYFFTKGWFENLGKNSEDYVIPEKTVAKIMAEKIQEEGQKNIWMAIYGIDDISDTMASVFDAISDKVKAGIPTYAVMDVSAEQQSNGFPRDYNVQRQADGRYAFGHKKVELDFSYVNPKDKYNAAFEVPGWAPDYLTEVDGLLKTMTKSKLKNYLLKDFFILPESKTKIYQLQMYDMVWIALNKNIENYQDSLSRIAFQYANNLQLLRLLNKNAKTNAETMAHVEFPFTGIMHNKFIVFEKNNGEKSVWTGTTNVARTCMGDESNSNLAVLIKNDAIAQAYLTEFQEMFSGITSGTTSKPKTLLTGVFHDKKKPNTNRYFTFKDGTEVRIHFSPTDDGEHRVLIPLIYSARKGDILRISMFGGGGYELVRAMQVAVAKGVQIKIVFDSLTGAGSTSWWKANDGNLLEQNPYSKNPLGNVEVRNNNWSGLNHHKTATLSRMLTDGSYQTEVIVFGSQNWSQTGNDINDENMVTIRNKSKALEIMDAFNQEFDTRLWPSSTLVVQD